MNSLVVLVAVLGSALASPQVLYNSPLAYNTPLAYNYAGAPLAYHGAAPAIVAPAFSKTQYHAQDELGQASYGYAHPGQAHSAVRDAAGNVRGSYAYVNPDGNEIRVNYVADGNGFRAESNALPAAPLVGPAPVQDTPEVVAARADHFRAIHEAKSRGKRQVIAHHPLAYSYGHIAHPNAALPLTHAGLPLAAPALHAHVPHLTHAVRPATLTKVVNNPGHAVSYRVDK